MAQQLYSLFELNEHIRRTIALNFNNAVWVRAEIAQLSESKGHYFIQLIEKEEGGKDIQAKADAVIWQSGKRNIVRKIGRIFYAVIKEGQQVSLLIRVNFDERYGLKFIIEDVDPAYTVGQLQLQRQKTIERLKSQNLLDKNAALELPIVLQRIAILSSENAAGYADFVTQLRQNPYGYSFNCVLFPIAVQGKDIARDIKRQLKELNTRKSDFDCAVIIRGGGAKVDLGGFDDLSIGESIAHAKLPVISGIGHEVDETVADIVAHTSLKTPTAAANFLIQQNAAFEGHLEHLSLQLKTTVQTKVKDAQYNLDYLQQQFRQSARQIIQLEQKQLDYLNIEIKKLCRQNVVLANKDLQQLEQLVQALSVESNLKRGFTITELNGKIVSSASLLAKGDKIMTRFKDGQKGSIVN